MLSHLGTENILYLLLHIKDENTWDRVINYCDLKETVKVEINGHDLKKLGLKAGPHFKTILEELYDLKLDGSASNRKDETKIVGQWIAEGRFLDGIIL